VCGGGGGQGLQVYRGTVRALGMFWDGVKVIRG
jgi:hypothetical protein